MKLSNCYVLLEPLNVPESEHFQAVGESLEDIFKALNLDELEKEEADQLETDDINAADLSEDEDEVDGDSAHSEEEFSLRNNKLHNELKDKAVKKVALSDMHKTKLI